MHDHQYWMQKALLLAEQAQALGEVPVGAILVRDDEIVGQGFNRPIINHDPTAHAEIIALRQAGQLVKNYRLIETTMYVTLEPCAMCAMAMVHARVKRLVYATCEPRTGAGGSLYQLMQHSGHNHQIEIVNDICQQQSAQMLTDFFRARRK